MCVVGVNRSMNFVKGYNERRVKIGRYWKDMEKIGEQI